MLPINILASGITHLTDARYFAAWQVDWMSFPLDGPGAVSPQMIMQIAEWVEGPRLMAHFSHTDWEEAKRQMEPLDLDGAVLSGSHYIDDIMSETGDLSIILELPATAYAKAEVIQNLDLEALTIFHKEEFNEDLVRHWRIINAPLLMNLGRQDNEKALQLVNDTQLAGLSVQGSAEEKVGLKSFEELDELYDLLMEE